MTSIPLPKNEFNSVLTFLLEPLYKEMKSVDDLNSWIRYRLDKDDKAQLLPALTKNKEKNIEMILTYLSGTILQNKPKNEYEIYKEIYNSSFLYIIFPGWRPVQDLSDPIIKECEMPWFNWCRHLILRYSQCEEEYPLFNNSSFLLSINSVNKKLIEQKELSEMLSTNLKVKFSTDSEKCIFNYLRYFLTLTMDFSETTMKKLVSVIPVEEIEGTIHDQFQVKLLSVMCSRLERNLLNNGGYSKDTVIEYKDVVSAFNKNNLWPFDLFIPRSVSSWNDVIPPDLPDSFYEKKKDLKNILS
jgi:hypothetical protein